MSKQEIKQHIESRLAADGLTQTGIKGVQIFRATHSIPCSQVVYDPCVIAIVSGSKEAILDGTRFVYDDEQYLCCPMSMPLKAGTPAATPDTPLLGVLISLDAREMTDLVIEIENAGPPVRSRQSGKPSKGIKLAPWDDDFSDALLRLLHLADNPMDISVLGAARLREFYYALLKGEAGPTARHAFGVGNSIARSIAHLSSNLEAPVTIDDMAERAGMSRAVFHRKFKQATTLSPLQFVKSLRLNSAAMKIAGGMAVNEAALHVGYTSFSQFSREFKRMYGQSPRHWGDTQKPSLAPA